MVEKEESGGGLPRLKTLRRHIHVENTRNDHQFGSLGPITTLSAESPAKTLFAVAVQALRSSLLRILRLHVSRVECYYRVCIR